MKKEVGKEIEKRPKVGVGVIVYDTNGRVLLGKRKNAHGEGCWAFPGGHLEYNEDVFDCARREVREETGIEIDGLQRVAFTNDIFTAEDKHYITLFVSAKHSAGEATALESDKCDHWDWFDPGQFPEPLFLTLENLKKQGFRYEYDFKSLR